jgi:hypothetical protein
MFNFVVLCGVLCATRQDAMQENRSVLSLGKKTEKLEGNN